MSEPLIVRQASATYPVWIGEGLLDRVGELAPATGAAFVVTSRTLRSFGERVASSLNGATLLEIEEGESAKSVATAMQLIDRLVEQGARRDATLYAVGGGMIGDTAGFAASIFMRGIRLVQVPTTLLAQVDSSIGGKVAVNHPFGKNLIGAFHPPTAVISDVTLLTTLPEQELRGGLFEVLKGGVIADPELFRVVNEELGLLLARDPKATSEAVRRKVLVKAGIVSADEREGGVRRVLNYGHTIGHAIETATRYEQLSHGEAVGWGMVAANAIAVRRGMLSADEAMRIDEAVEALAPRRFSADSRAMLEAAAHDKKNRAGVTVMVLPRRIGECAIAEDVTADELAWGIAAVLERQR